MLCRDHLFGASCVFLLYYLWTWFDKRISDTAKKFREHTYIIDMGDLMAESRFRGKKRSKRRTRYHCQYCQQSLGYSAFRRHKDLPSMYCPGVSSTRTNYEHESESSDSSDSTFVSPATRTARMSSQENDHVLRWIRK